MLALLASYRARRTAQGRARRTPFERSLLWLVLAGCGDGGDRPMLAPTDASVPEGDANLTADYQGCEGLAPFALGMVVRGQAGKLEAVVVDATPAPPERYRNDWVVTLRSADGGALDDVSLTEARPFMPLHGHDGGVAPVITKLSEPGQFQLERLNLSMRGAWEIQLTASSPSAGDDYIVFHVCVME
jgi:hypothetical protein